MSRALFLSLRKDDVIAKCQAAKVDISAIEQLPQGGTRLVCMSVDGASSMRRKLKTHLIASDAPRTAIRPAGPLW